MTIDEMFLLIIGSLSGILVGAFIAAFFFRKEILMQKEIIEEKLTENIYTILQTKEMVKKINDKNMFIVEHWEILKRLAVETMKDQYYCEACRSKEWLISKNEKLGERNDNT